VKILCDRFGESCGESFSQDERAHPSPNWEDWIFAESRRRYGYHPSCLAALRNLVFPTNLNYYFAGLHVYGSSSTAWCASAPAPTARPHSASGLSRSPATGHSGRRTRMQSGSRSMTPGKRCTAGVCPGWEISSTHRSGPATWRMHEGLMYGMLGPMA
jgi:hypothetical protein